MLSPHGCLNSPRRQRRGRKRAGADAPRGLRVRVRSRPELRRRRGHADGRAASPRLAGSGRGALAGGARRPGGRLDHAYEVDGGTGRLGHLVLTPEARGSGAGRRLVEQVLEAARAAPYGRLELATFSDLSAAGNLYRSVGFARVSNERPCAGDARWSGSSTSSSLTRRLHSLRAVNPRIVVALFLVGSSPSVLSFSRPAETRSDDTAPNTFEGSLMPEGVRAPDFASKNQDGETVLDALAAGPAGRGDVPLHDLRGHLPDPGADRARRARRARPRRAGAGDRGRPAARHTGSARRPSSQSSAPPGASTSCSARRAELRPLWKGYAIRPQSVTQEHQARFTLVDSRGFQRIGYPGPRPRPSGWRTTCACSSASAARVLLHRR